MKHLFKKNDTEAVKPVSSTQKYGFTGERKVINGVELYRIRALRDFYALKPYESITELEDLEFDEFEFRLIKAGTLGGWIEREENLAQEGFAWVADEACVYGEAKVSEGALIYGEAQVYDKAKVRNYARVFGKAKVHGHTTMLSRSVVCEEADVETGFLTENAQVYGRAHLYGDGAIDISHDAKVYDDAVICSYEEDDYAFVENKAKVYEHAHIEGDEYETRVGGNARVSGEARVVDGSEVGGYARISGTAQIVCAEVHGATICGATVVMPHCYIKNAYVNLQNEKDYSGISDLASGLRIEANAHVTDLADVMRVGPFKATDKTYLTLVFAIHQSKRLMMEIFQEGVGAGLDRYDGNVYMLDEPEAMEHLLRGKYGKKTPGFVDEVLKAAEYARGHFAERVKEIKAEHDRKETERIATAKAKQEAREAAEGSEN